MISPLAKSNDYASAFGEALSKQLSARQVTPYTLANNTGVSPSFVSRAMHGKRTVSPEWADTIAKALALNDKEARDLHRAAALDAGYKLDLTKK